MPQSACNFHKDNNRSHWWSPSEATPSLISHGTTSTWRHTLFHLVTSRHVTSHGDSRLERTRFQTTPDGKCTNPHPHIMHPKRTRMYLINHYVMATLNGVPRAVFVISNFIIVSSWGSECSSLIPHVLFMPEFESGFSVEYGVDRLASWWTVVVTKLGLEATRLVRLKDGLTSVQFRNSAVDTTYSRIWRQQAMQRTLL